MILSNSLENATVGISGGMPPAAHPPRLLLRRLEPRWPRPPTATLPRFPGPESEVAPEARMVLVGLAAEGGEDPGKGGDDLARRFFLGDPETIHKVERWADEVLRWKNIPPDDREDLIQDTLAALWVWPRNPANSPDEILNLRALARTIAGRRAADWFRQQETKRKKESQIKIEEGGRRAGRDPIEVLIRKTDVATLHRLLRKLSPRCRQIIGDKFSRGMKNREIAERRSITTGGVGANLNKCVKELRRLFKELEGPEAPG